MPPIAGRGSCRADSNFIYLSFGRTARQEPRPAKFDSSDTSPIMGPWVNDVRIAILSGFDILSADEQTPEMHSCAYVFCYSVSC